MLAFSFKGCSTSSRGGMTAGVVKHVVTLHHCMTNQEARREMITPAHLSSSLISFLLSLGHQPSRVGLPYSVKHPGKHPQRVTQLCVSQMIPCSDRWIVEISQCSPRRQGSQRASWIGLGSFTIKLSILVYSEE